MRTFGEAGQNRGTARGTDAGGDEGVLKSNAVRREAVDVRSLHDWMTSAAQDVGAMIVGDEENNVWRFRILSDRSRRL